MSTKTAKHIIFSGRVQGVGFRFTTYRIARQNRLAGFVRNLPDGTVEMFAQGRDDDITASLRDIAESFSGYLRGTEITDAAPDGGYNSFDITF